MTLARLIEAVEQDDCAAVWEALEGKPVALGFQAGDFVNAFHGSLDAAKRLHDALLPGWWATMRYSTRPLVTVGDVDDEFRAQDDNLARAWLLCILRAVEGRDQ